MEVLEREMAGESGFAVEVERHLATCMQKLGEKQHALIQGYYHENRSVEWLAEQGGRSVEAVYKAIQRTRIDLQTCIQRQIRKEIT
jgi:DNA-directed RNA polymerase specialized sigma24 family protein